AGAHIGRVGEGHAGLGGRGDGRLLTRLLSFRTRRDDREGTRRDQRRDHAVRQQERRGVPVSHAAEWEARAAVRDRKHPDRGEARRESVGVAERSGETERRQTYRLTPLSSFNSSSGRSRRSAYSCDASLSVKNCGKLFFRFTTFGASLITM